MFDAIRAKKGTTQRLTAMFVDTAGALKTGLTVSVRVIRVSDDKFLKNDATWTAAPSTEYTATEWDSANMPGVYYYDFAIPDTKAPDEYMIRFDGSADAATRYQFAWLEAIDIATWIASSLNITVGSVVTSQLPGNRRVTPASLEGAQGCAKTFQISQVDSDGEYRDLSDMTLRFIAFNENDPPVSLFKVEAETITLNDDNDVASVPVTSTQMSTANANCRWILIDTGSDDEEIAQGPFKAHPVATDHS